MSELLMHAEASANVPGARIEADVDIAQAKLDTDVIIANAKNTNLRSLEMFKAVILAGQNALRATFLMNGGASIAILAFIGRIATYNSGKASFFALSLTLFVIGIVFSSIASGVAYLAQSAFTNEKSWMNKHADKLNIAAIICNIIAIVLFITGTISVYKVFSSF